MLLYTVKNKLYLKLSGCPVGLLINFNVRQLTEGIKRFRI